MSLYWIAVLNAIMLNVILLNVIMLNVILLNVILLNAIMLNVVVPSATFELNWVKLLFQKTKSKSSKWICCTFFNNNCHFSLLFFFEKSFWRRKTGPKSSFISLPLKLARHHSVESCSAECSVEGSHSQNNRYAAYVRFFLVSFCQMSVDGFILFDWYPFGKYNFDWYPFGHMSFLICHFDWYPLAKCRFACHFDWYNLAKCHFNCYHFDKSHFAS